MQEKTRSLILEQVRGILISAVVGLGIVYLVTFSERGRFTPGVAAYGALIGAFGYVFCAGLAWLLSGWFAKTRLPTWIAHAGVYFLGGVAGWLLANRVAAGLGLVHFRVSFAELRAYFPVAGVAGVMVGLVFYGFSLLQNRQIGRAHV